MTYPRTSKPSPWWAEVEHLRTTPETGRHQSLQPAPTRRAERHPAPAERHVAPAAGRDRPRSAAAAASPRRRNAERPEERPDWFAQEARTAGRRTKAPEPAPQRPDRPRATLVDVAPAHALVRRAPQTRRRAGERPTVTITGRPEAALPPRPAAPPELVRAARTRERVSSLTASPDRMILWAVALGILMIVASIATGTAGA